MISIAPADRLSFLFLLSPTSQRLKVAYVNKERAAQHEENQLSLQMQQDEEQAIADKARRRIPCVQSGSNRFVFLSQPSKSSSKNVEYPTGPNALYLAAPNAFQAAVDLFLLLPRFADTHSTN